MSFMPFGQMPALTGIPAEEEQEEWRPPMALPSMPPGQEIIPAEPQSGDMQFPFGAVGDYDVDIDQTQLQGYMNPRRAMWSGVMFDLANHFLSGRRAGLSGLGTKQMFAAMKNNAALEQQARQRQMAQQQALNPYKDMPQEFQEYKLAEMEGFKGSYEDWIRDNAAKQSGRPVRTFTGENGNMWYVSAGGDAVDTGVKASPGGMKIRDVGGVPYVEIEQPGGEIKMQTLNEFQQNYRTRMIENETRTEELSTKFAAADAQFELEVPKMYQQQQQQLTILRELEAAIESGQYQDTGYFEGRVRPLIEQQMAYLEALNINSTLSELQRVNLAPVTEAEIALLRQLFPDVLAEPGANLGRIKAAIQRIENSNELMLEQMLYYRDQNTLRGYFQGGNKYLESLQRPAEAEDASAPGDMPDPVAFDD